MTASPTRSALLKTCAIALGVGFLVACGGKSDESDSGLATLITEAPTTTGTTNSNPTSTTGTTGSTTTSTTTMCATGPLAAPIPNCTLTPPPSTGDLAQDCVDRINQFRWQCQCLPPLDRWTDAEDCVDQQAADDQAVNTAHANFGSCGAMAQNTCPNWGSESSIVDGCLQMMWDEGPGDDFAVYGHYLNMSNTSYTKVACGLSNNGQVWANQNFR